MSALARLLQKIAGKMKSSQWIGFLEKLGIKGGEKMSWKALAAAVKAKVKAQPKWVLFIAETAASFGVFAAADEIWQMIFGEDEPSDEQLAAVGLGDRDTLRGMLASVVNKGTNRSFGDGEDDDETTGQAIFQNIQDINDLNALINAAGGDRVVEAVMSLMAYEPSVIREVLAARKAGMLRGWGG